MRETFLLASRTLDVENTVARPPYLAIPFSYIIICTFTVQTQLAASIPFSYIIIYIYCAITKFSMAVKENYVVKIPYRSTT